jgi:hypothetical protein
MVARDHLRGEIPMASIHPNPFIADRSPSPDDGVSLALSYQSSGMDVGSPNP